MINSDMRSEFNVKHPELEYVKSILACKSFEYWEKTLWNPKKLRIV